MQEIVVIHGYIANKDSNWFPWLKNEFEGKGIKVSVLDMPNSQQPNLDSWLNEMRIRINQDNLHNTLIVGHSLGCITTLKYIEQLNYDRKIKAVILVSGFSQNVEGLQELDTFTDEEVDYSNILQKTAYVKSIASSNDDIVPIEYSRYLSRQLDSEIIEIDNAGHFLDTDGYTSFEKLKEEIIQII